MIYFISRQTRLFEDEGIIRSSTIEHCLEYFKDVKSIQVDTETNSYDCHTGILLCIQLGDFENQFVVDLTTMNIELLKPLLESDITLLFQNAKFDLRWLYKNNIWPKRIYDTFLAELLLKERALKKGNKKEMDKEGNEIIIKSGLALDDLTVKYCNAFLDKSIRGNIHKEGLTTRVILYAASDVKYLHDIAKKQWVEIQKRELQGVLKLENRFIKSLAYAEFCGFYVDKVKWLENNLEDKKKLVIKGAELTKWVLANDIQGIRKQYNMFDEVPDLSINWASSKQVIKVFESLEIDCDVIDKGKKKKSVEAKHIAKQKNKSTLIPIYLDYKELEKKISTYGIKFLEHVNKATQRIHSDFFPIINTGRLSSSNPNLQNIDSGAEVRACFKAEEGNMLTINDYSSQEPRSLAGLSNDSRLIDFFENGDGDIHSFVASKLYTVINGKDTKITKENYKERQVGKILNLKLNYGGAAYTVKDDLNTDEEGAQVFITALEKAFPEKEVYFKNKIKECFDNKYILTNNVTKRKIFLQEFGELEKMQNWLNEAKQNKIEIPKKFWSDYYKIKGSLERCSKNYPIQGSAADQTKLAGALIFEWVIENNLQGIVKICSYIHDEIVLEAPKDMINEVGATVQRFMEQAGKYIIPNMEFPAEPCICEYWKKG